MTKMVADYGKTANYTRRLTAVFFLLVLAPFVRAASLGAVEAVRAPAWLERGGAVQPLAPGMALQSGDVVRTGGGARAWLLLAEGSRVKLGETARLALHSRSLDPDRLFRGALDATAGAFRFTTGASGSAATRDLAIRVGRARVGLHGTDVWGRAGGRGEAVALLAGRIEIARGDEILDLAEPMTYFEAPRGGTAMVRLLAAGQRDLWLRETDIQPGDGAARSQGNWRVLAATATDDAEAQALHDRLHLAGFAVHIRPVRAASAEGGSYELFLGSFADCRDAEAAAARLSAQTGLAAIAVAVR